MVLQPIFTQNIQFTSGFTAMLVHWYVKKMNAVKKGGNSMTANVINYFKLLEDKRSHQAQEELTARDIAEKQRHNIAAETQAANELFESQRHARVVEEETGRHNIAEEGLSSQRNAIAAYSASIDATRAQTEAAKAIENERHNRVTEKETEREHRYQDELDLYRTGGTLAKTILGGASMFTVRSVIPATKIGGLTK